MTPLHPRLRWRATSYRFRADAYYSPYNRSFAGIAFHLRHDKDYFQVGVKQQAFLSQVAATRLQEVIGSSIQTWKASV